MKAPTTFSTATKGGPPMVDTLTQVQDIVAEITGNEPEEITRSTQLEELRREDLPGIIAKINRHFGVELTAKYVMSACETVADLIDVIEEEQELG